MAREDWETRRERQRQGIAVARQRGFYTERKADKVTHDRVIALREAGHSIARTAKLAGCSVAQVKRVWATYKVNCIESKLGKG